MRYKRYLLLFFFCMLAACSSSQKEHNISLQEICGRDTGNPSERIPIYRAKVPNDWTRKNPGPQDSIQDTTKALCEFYIPGENSSIRITIHNFPSETKEHRIPPQAQIARWKRQFSHLDSVDSNVTLQAFSGYSGLLFTGKGLLEDKETVMMGWAMMLAPEHYSTLSIMINNAKTDLASLKQKRGDVTIKATGNPQLMEKHRNKIISFARSFELIEEIPPPS